MNNQVDLESLLNKLAEVFSIYFTPMEQISLRNAILRRRAKIGIIQVEDVQAPVINLRSPEAVMRFFLQKTDSEDIKRK